MHICNRVQLSGTRRGLSSPSGGFPRHPGYRHGRGREDLRPDRDRRRAGNAGRGVRTRRPRLAGMAAAGSGCGTTVQDVLVENLRHVSATFREAGVERLVLARAVRREDELDAIRQRSAPASSSVVRLVASHGAIEGGCADATRAPSSPSTSRSRRRSPPRRRRRASESRRLDGRQDAAATRAPSSSARAGARSLRAPDERRGRRHRDESEPLEDRPARRPTRRPQVAESARGRQIRAVGHERAVDPRLRQEGSVPPPHSVAKPLPSTRRSQPAPTTVSPASATTIARRRGPPHALPRGCRRASPVVAQITDSMSAIRARSARSPRRGA